MDEAEYNKSEQATPFKLMRAHEKGMVVRGMDLGFFTSLAAFLGCLWAAGWSMATQIALSAKSALAIAPNLVSDPGALLTLTAGVLTSIVRPLALMSGTIFLVVLLFELVQTGVVFTAQPLKPDFSRINPAKGLKRLFSLRVLLESAKNIIKLIAYSIVAMLMIHTAYKEAALVVTGGDILLESMAASAFHLVMFFLLVALVIAVLDQILVRRDYSKKMRMSRREVRKELRDREGEPRMKQRRQKLHAEFAKMSQSLRNVKSADLLITNPNHYAVALKYAPERMTAPTVVSQGANVFALRLKRIAFIYGVITVENKTLARDLFRYGVLNQEIPDQLYGQVAELYIEISKKKNHNSGIPSHA